MDSRYTVLTPNNMEAPEKTASRLPRYREFASEQGSLTETSQPTESMLIEEPTFPVERRERDGVSVW